MRSPRTVQQMQTVVHFEDFLVRIDYEVVVDPFFSEFVDNDGITLAVPFGENPIEQRGLTGAEETGQYGDRDLLSLIHERVLQAVGISARLALQHRGFQN